MERNSRIDYEKQEVKQSMNDELRKKVVLTADDVQKILQLGRNKTYEFLKNDCPVPVIRVGHQIRVPAKQFFEWLDSLTVAAV